MTVFGKAKRRYVFTPMLSGLRWPGQTIMGSWPPAVKIWIRSFTSVQMFHTHTPAHTHTHPHTHTHTPAHTHTPKDKYISSHSLKKAFGTNSWCTVHVDTFKKFTSKQGKWGSQFSKLTTPGYYIEMHSGSTTLFFPFHLEFSAPVSNVGQVAATSLRRGLGVGPQVRMHHPKKPPYPKKMTRLILGFTN